MTNGPVVQRIRVNQAAGMRKHIRELTAKHGIKVKPAKHGREYADPNDKTIHIPKVTGPLAYFVALHEIAHVVHKRAAYLPGRNRTEYKKNVLAAECAAWQWAISKSKFPVPHWMYQRIATCVQGYWGKTGWEL